MKKNIIYSYNINTKIFRELWILEEKDWDIVPDYLVLTVGATSSHNSHHVIVRKSVWEINGTWTGSGVIYGKTSGALIERMYYYYCVGIIKDGKNLQV